jgi:hypothetical protein
LLAQEKLDHTATIVTIFCDDNKKYLSTASDAGRTVEGQFPQAGGGTAGVSMHAARVCPGLGSVWDLKSLEQSISTA